MSYSHIPDVPAQMVEQEIKPREFEQYEHLSIRIDNDGHGNRHVKVNGNNMSVDSAIAMLGKK